MERCAGIGNYHFDDEGNTNKMRKISAPSETVPLPVPLPAVWFLPPSIPEYPRDPRRRLCMRTRRWSDVYQLQMVEDGRYDWVHKPEEPIQLARGAPSYCYSSGRGQWTSDDEDEVPADPVAEQGGPDGVPDVVWDCESFFGATKFLLRTSEKTRTTATLLSTGLLRNRGSPGTEGPQA